MHAGNIDQLIANINTYIINPFIGFLFVLATADFLYGIILYFFVGGKGGAVEQPDATARETGKKHITWGLIGMFIMISVFGIMRVIVTTFGINLGEFGTSLPQ